MTPSPPAESLLTVLVPLFNERESLLELYERICRTMEAINRPFEILFVNDGSTDGGDALLDDLHARDQRVQVIHFRRNFGKAAALAAGFPLVRGEVIVTLDGDLQDPPEEIPRFLEALDGGLDLVSGWKTPRRDPWRKRVASRVYNAVTALTTGVRLHDMNCGFKAYRRELIEHLNLYGELHRYIPVLAAGYGFRVGEIPVRHQPRRHGRSKYGWWRYFSGFFDLLTVLVLTRFAARPLHVFGLTGLLVSLVGGALTVYLVAGRLAGSYLGNRPLFYFALSALIVGVQVLFFGLLAEMITQSRRADAFYSIRQVRRHESAGHSRGDSL